MIDVISLVDRDVVSEKLQWNYFDDRQKQFGSIRNIKDVLRDGADFFIALGRDGYERPLARSHFLHDLESPPVTQDGVRIAAIAGRQYHHRKLVVDECVRTVLQF